MLAWQEIKLKITFGAKTSLSGIPQTLQTRILLYKILCSNLKTSVCRSFAKKWNCNILLAPTLNDMNMSPWKPRERSHTHTCIFPASKVYGYDVHTAKDWGQWKLLKIGKIRKDRKQKKDKIGKIGFQWETRENLAFPRFFSMFLFFMFLMIFLFF